MTIITPFLERERGFLFHPMKDIEKAKQLFKKAGLPFPPIPKEMAHRFQCLYPWMFGTRTDAPNPYGIHLYIEELKSKYVEDYLMLGHSGHGVNSYAIHYYMVRGPLAIILQWGWGGCYMDNERQSSELAVHFDTVRAILRATMTKSFINKITYPKRFLIVETDFARSRWGTIEIVKNGENLFNFRDCSNSLLEALQWIRSLRKI